MGPNYLKAEYYFKDLAYLEVFSGIKYVWEAVSKIPEFLKDKDITIGKNTVIEKGAIIKAPTIIGDNCEIRFGAYIRGNVIIGDNCVIRSEVKNSLIMHNTNATHLSYIGDSIIGKDCNLGAGTILSNLKLSEENIKIKIDDKTYDTKLKKFGAIFGDSVKTGCHVVTNPGTLVGRNVFIYPHANIKGFFESSTIIKHKQNLEVIRK